MRTSILLTLLALGCTQPAPNGTPFLAAPSAPPKPEVAVPPPAAAGSCAYSEAIEPVEPTEPTQACRREMFAADGALLERLERRVDVYGGTATTTEETIDQDGNLANRVVRRTEGGLLVFESLETLSLAPDATLPYTYGQPATYSVTYEHGSGGQVTRETTDLAMDGTIDDEQRWTFNASGVVTRHELVEGAEAVWTETWRGDGQPLTRLDSGSYGQRWTYDGAGLLTREETLSAGQVADYTLWNTKAPGVPLESRRVHVGTAEEIVGQETWTYDAAGRLDVMQGWGRVYGFDRKNRTEYDDLGRETRYEEHTEEPSCHAYVRTSTYLGDVLLDQTTTCDGGPFEHLWTTVDAQGRPVHYERTFDGNPLSPTHETDDVGYDACGAQTFHRHTWNGKVTAKAVLTLDALGRIVSRTSSYGQSQEGTAEYVYDANGHVLSMDGSTFTWDGAGRLVRIDRASKEVVRFTFTCDADPA